MLLIAALAALACAGTALATSFTSGDVVVYRVGNGTEPLTSSASPVYLNEYEPNGNLVFSDALPTAASGKNKPLVASGSATSEGLLTLSENDLYLMLTGYDAAVGRVDISETKSSGGSEPVPRTIARVSKTAEINTETALTNWANENNPRSATSTEGTKIWVGGAGKATSGGAFYTTLGSSTGTSLNETDANVRQVEVVDGQLYVSADPTKNGVDLATVGSGEPTTKGNMINNLPFAPESSPVEPYAYSLLTLKEGGTTPDTAYVADKEALGGEGGGAIVKYGLNSETKEWVKEGSVEVPYITGVTANDVNGIVTIYATASGKNGRTGILYEMQDVSGYGGTLEGAPEEIAEEPASADEAFRGVAFAPGTTIGKGGTPPPAPKVIPAENYLPAALGDPTNQSMPITFEDPAYAANELKITVHSSNKAVAPEADIMLTGSGSHRTLSVIPGAVGISRLIVTAEAPNHVAESALVTYGASENLGANVRYYEGVGGIGSTEIDVGEGYMLVGGSEDSILRLYKERTSTEPIKTWNFTNLLPYGTSEMDMKSAARAGNTIYWMGSLGNSHHGERRPSNNVVWATTITGSGASTELSYAGSYTHLREDLIDWDDENGAPLGFAESAAEGVPDELANGFRVEGLEFAAESSTEAYVAFRAPMEPPSERNLALLVPVTNFSSVVTAGNPGTVEPTFGPPMEWNLGGLTVRGMRKNANNEYLIIAGTTEGSDTEWRLYAWNGETENNPVPLTVTPTIEGLPAGEGAAWETVRPPDPIRNGDQLEMVETNDETVWYQTKDAKNGLQGPLQKDLGDLFTVEMPPPATPGAPHLKSGNNPNDTGQFTLAWKPSESLRPEFKLEHENAEGGWSTVATGLTKHEYTFTAASPEREDTWVYRVSEANESGESEPSGASEAIKVDKTPPYTPTASASRPPDYAGKGGWYKNSVTVSFTAHGDPNLSDGSAGSGVNPATLTEPETFETSGVYNACGTVADYAGNVSAPGCLTVQVESTPPSLELACPAKAVVGEAGVHATLTASDAYSGLATPASEAIPIETLTAGPKTVTRTAVSNVGLETTRSCTTQVVYRTPSAPVVSAGTNPNDTGLFTLGWSGDDPLDYLGLGYTLQEHNAATQTWTTVTTGIEALSYAFTGAGEQEGTWVYRLQAEAPPGGEPSEYSPASAPVVVDKTPPYAPTATASRAPDYAGGGGWYKNSVEVSFTANGDPNLSDGSPGSGVNPSSVPATQTFDTSGSHTTCGTVTDYAGNVSQPGCLTVQVDATPPSLEITCPAHVLSGSTVSASFTASDKYSGLASAASGSVPIDTGSTGQKTVSTTAVSNVGLETTKSCTTQVESSTPSAPKLTVGASPNNTGVFTLGWAGPHPLEYFGLTYTLEHHNAATSKWSVVAVGLEALSYEFALPSEEEREGTWVYRVQASDPGTDLVSEYSPVSAPVVVDKTPPYAPTASASRAPDYSGGGGWYKNSVEVSFKSNGDPNLSDGSPGSGVNPSSIPATQKFDTSGSHTACGTVSDYAGNVSQPGCLTVQVDATPPSLEISCPARVLQGSTMSASFTASDKYSGLASAASGSVPINTGSTGQKTVSTTAVSNVGLETTKSCTTQVESSTPGAPKLTAGRTPNNTGLFTLGWTGPNPAEYFGLTYTLQHENAASDARWTTVVLGLEGLSYEFTPSEEEKEDTWIYRVRASDPAIGLTSEYSPVSAPVVVDKTPPYAPTATASRAPDYSGGGGWYKNSVEVSFKSNGDPNLPDGSPGSGVNPATLSGPQSFDTSGSHTACGTVADYAGNVSAPGCVTVQVDATPPSLEVACPESVKAGEAADATVTASDQYSGLAVNPSGEVPIDTDRIGVVTTTRTAVSNVGLETTRSCTTKVVGSLPEFGRCVTVRSGGKYASASCETPASRTKDHYEWETVVPSTQFTTASSLAITLETKKGTTTSAKITCTGEKGAGEYTGPKTVGGVVLELEGCKLQSIDATCESAHAASGKIVTQSLDGVLGVYEEPAGKPDKVGLDLHPAQAGALTEFICGPRETIVVRGSMIATLTASKMLMAQSWKLKAKMGEQDPEAFTTGAKDILEASFDGAPFLQVGLTAPISQANPEKLEVNPVV